MSREFLDAWRVEWQRAGFVAHPLQPAGNGWRGKEYVPGLENVPPLEQWARAYKTGDFWNMGVLPGRHRACLDCDSPLTAGRIREALGGLGVPIVEEGTAREGGAHIWLSVADFPDSNFFPFGPDIGPGHLLTGHSNVVVTCSRIGDQAYRFVTGGPADIAGLPVLHFRDISFVLRVDPSRPGGQASRLTAPPLRVFWRPVPDVLAMLQELRGWDPGTTYRGFASASEAEAAAVARFILAGWDYDAIAHEFERFCPGSYVRNMRGRFRYLRRTYEHVLGDIARTEPRPAIAAAWRAVQAAAWPGRGGLLDRAVLLGLLSFAWQWQATVVTASERELAEYAGGTRQGVNKALGRLRQAGLIRRVGYIRGAATAWDVTPLLGQTLPDSHDGAGGVSALDVWTTRPKETAAVCGDAGAEHIELPGGNELWSCGKLGRSAGAVYGWLGHEVVTTAELARLTGKSSSTIGRALARLQAVGLAEPVGVGWVRGRQDVIAVADDMGAEIAARLRHERHDRERLAWQDTLQRGG